MKPTLFLPLLLVLATLLTASAASPIGDALKPFVEQGELAGAVALVASKDKVLAVEAVGFADRATQRVMKTDAVFWIASQSKPITGAAVMMLVDEGKLNLDDAVEKYLPEFKGQQLDAGKGPDGKPMLKAPAHPITVREVLSHTSGLPFKSAAEQPTLDALPLRDAVASYGRPSHRTSSPKSPKTSPPERPRSRKSWPSIATKSTSSPRAENT